MKRAEQEKERERIESYAAAIFEKMTDQQRQDETEAARYSRQSLSERVYWKAHNKVG